jgi:hypothetical protein
MVMALDSFANAAPKRPGSIKVAAQEQAVDDRRGQEGTGFNIASNLNPSREKGK